MNLVSIGACLKALQCIWPWESQRPYIDKLWSSAWRGTNVFHRVNLNLKPFTNRISPSWQWKLGRLLGGIGMKVRGACVFWHRGFSPGRREVVAKETTRKCRWSSCPCSRESVSDLLRGRLARLGGFWIRCLSCEVDIYTEILKVIRGKWILPYHSGLEFLNFSFLFNVSETRQQRRGDSSLSKQSPCGRTLISVMHVDYLCFSPAQPWTWFPPSVHWPVKIIKITNWSADSLISFVLMT